MREVTIDFFFLRYTAVASPYALRTSSTQTLAFIVQIVLDHFLLKRKIKYLLWFVLHTGVRSYYKYGAHGTESVETRLLIEFYKKIIIRCWSDDAASLPLLVWSNSVDNVSKDFAEDLSMKTS